MPSVGTKTLSIKRRKEESHNYWGPGAHHSTFDRNREGASNTETTGVSASMWQLTQQEDMVKLTGDGKVKSYRARQAPLHMRLPHIPQCKNAASGKNTTAYGTHRKEQTVVMSLGRGSWSISSVPSLSSGQEGKDAQRTLTGKFLDLFTLPLVRDWQ